MRFRPFFDKYETTLPKQFFLNILFLFSILNSRMSWNMCIWRHNLCNAKTGVGPTFTWLNEPWYNTKGKKMKYMMILPWQTIFPKKCRDFNLRKNMVIRSDRISRFLWRGKPLVIWPEWTPVNPSEPKWTQVNPSEPKWTQVNPGQVRSI